MNRSVSDFVHHSMYRTLSIMLAAACSAAPPTATPPTTDEPGAEASTDTPASDSLANAINAYRAERGLAPIPISPALTAVAAAHVRDLEESSPVTDSCNFHSWSSAGSWSACCYTSDHAQAQCMWDKPRELTDYPGNGYEVAAGGTAPMTIPGAVRLWDGSPPHRDVIVNGGAWTRPWGAMGAAIRGRHAVAWFGHEREP